MSTPIDLIRGTYESRAKLAVELRSIDEDAQGREYTDSETKRSTELRSALDSVDARLGEQLKAEVRAATMSDTMSTLVGLMHNDKGEVLDTRSIAHRFAEDDEVRAWISHGSRGTSPAVNLDMELRAVTNYTTGQTSGGAFVNNERLSRVGMDFLDRKTWLVDLLPSISVSTGSIEYVQDKSPLADFADKAVEVTEAAAKPQAGNTFLVITEAAAVIAAWVNITRQIAADSPQLRGYIENRLRYALKRRVDSEVINGDGMAPNILGLLNRAGINTYTAPAGSEPAYRSIRKAITAMEQVETVPEIIVLNPSDAENFDLSNESTAGVHAVIDFDGGLRNAGARTAWGLQVVKSTAIAPLTGLLIDPMSVAVLDRASMAMFMTDSHASNFTSNILTLLGEVRVGLAVFEPKGVTKVTFDYTP